MPYPQKQVSDPATARRRLILYKLALPHSLPCHRPFLPFIFRRLASALRSATRLSHHDDHKNCQPKFLHAFSPIAIHTIFQSGSVIQLSPEIVNALNPLPLSPNLNPNHSPYPKLYTPPKKRRTHADLDLFYRSTYILPQNHFFSCHNPAELLPQFCQAKHRPS